MKAHFRAPRRTGREAQGISIRCCPDCEKFVWFHNENFIYRNSLCCSICVNFEFRILFLSLVLGSFHKMYAEIRFSNALSTNYSDNTLVLGCWQSLKGDLCLSELRFWFSCWVFLITAVSMLSNRCSSTLNENANNTKQLPTTGFKAEGKKTCFKNFTGISVACSM